MMTVEGQKYALKNKATEGKVVSVPTSHSAFRTELKSFLEVDFSKLPRVYKERDIYYTHSVGKGGSGKSTDPQSKAASVTDAM